VQKKKKKNNNNNNRYLERSRPSSNPIKQEAQAEIHMEKN
jgi:hypothetical protein